MKRPAPEPFKGIDPFLYHATRLAGLLFLTPFFKLTVEGRGGLPDQGPLVFLSKHQRWEDIPLIGLATFRPQYYVAKHELFMNPISRWYLRGMGGIPLNRGKPMESRSSMKHICQVLERGEWVVVFPEGTYYKHRTGPGHSGLIRWIRSRISVPFVPVGIHYSEGELRCLVRIRFGELMHVGSSENIEEFTGRVMKEIARLSDLEQEPSPEATDP